MAGRPKKTESTKSSTTQNVESQEKEIAEKVDGSLEKDDDSEKKKESDMSVSDYFNYVKNLKKETDVVEVQNIITICEKLFKKFELLGQVEAAKKAKNALSVATKDIMLSKHGVTTYVLIDEVTKYLSTIANHSVKITEIRNFPRSIPDDVCDKWLEVKDLFDEGFIVFTDYTEDSEEDSSVAGRALGKSSTAKDVKQRRKEKDPILFGAIKVDGERSSLRNNTYEKLYYIADWVDDYCDLTFSKLVSKMAKELKVSESEIKKETSIPETEAEFKKLAGL